MSAWDRKRLCEEISALERKQKELVKVLARIDPEVRISQIIGIVLGLPTNNCPNLSTYGSYDRGISHRSTFSGWRLRWHP